MAIPHANVRAILDKHGYTEVRTIGEGSFGKAVLVNCKEDGSRAVCKMIDVSKATAKETKDAAKEGQLLAQLKYPYIVRYRENFTASGWFVLVMDYCKGGDLSAQITAAKKSRKLMEEEQVLRWFSQAMLALKYIHDRHILHRDLKPGNFFLSRNGTVKMGDFGIAKVLASSAACAKTQIGTPYYLSPEVCQEKPYDWSSDIWAMGCLLYELCAQKVPFEAPNISSLVQKICKGPIPSPPGSYSPFLRDLCGEMLNRNPSLRPSADDILKKPQIQHIVKGMLEEASKKEFPEGQQAPPPSARPPQQPDSARPPQRPDSARPPHHRVASPSPRPRQTPSPSPHPSPPPTPEVAPAVAGAYYRVGDLIEYFSSTHANWLPASILKVDASGSIVIDLKPNTWMTKDMQDKKIRRRRPASRAKRPPSAGRGSVPSRVSHVGGA
jgi:NIMA (never in mitosis gene a)-related kinase